VSAVADLTCVAWGAAKQWAAQRGREVEELLSEPVICLVNERGTPCHPLARMTLVTQPHTPLGELAGSV